MANSKRKCRFCGEHKRVGEMKIINGVAYCSEDHAVQYSFKASPQVRKKQAKSEKAANWKKKRDYLSTNKPHQEKLTQEQFNKMIRALDRGCPCISCGREKCGGIWDAGHFKSVGSHPELRFDPRNCFRQGSGCNRATERRSRNAQTVSKEYEERLGAKYGSELVDWLNGPHDPAHFHCEELKHMRGMFAAEARHLEAGGKPTRDWRKLPEK